MPAPVIQALSPLTIQKIAAGEVIERPANVVKELVENALDAGATKITVTLEDGGKELIRVADNGSGMMRADALNCFLAHTTSKIRHIEDLETVSSLGFRGEALASMASVAELTVETRFWEDAMGTRIRIVEGRREEPEDAVRNPGTAMTVRHLFRHNPVRRKFLASAKTEGARITALLTRLSLAHPATAFRVAEGARETLHLPEGTLRRRAGDVLGAHLLEDLIEVDWEEGGIHLQGYVSEPQRFSSRQNQQHFFVNRRHVHSGMLSRALANAYEVAPPGRYPVAALFLSVPPAEVDVNVHPTKREVRFLQEARVFWAVSQSLRRALRRAVAAPALSLTETRPWAQTEPAKAAENREDLSIPFESGVRFLYDPAAEAGAPIPKAATQIVLPLEPQPARSMAEGGAPCLQIHRGFILVAVQSGFLLVNQQAAHERILYEKALEDLRKPGRFSAQQLLFPELVELSGPEARVVEERLAELKALGFDLEPFGSTAFQLRGLPAEVGPEKAQTILDALIAGLLGEAGNAKEDHAARVARAYARAAAIPLGEALDASRMSALVDGLFATRNPYVTPGGDPVLIRYSLEEIRRRFGLKPDSAT